MDWITHGKQLRHFKYPPPLNFELAEIFGEDLSQVCSEKILEARQRYELLEKKKESVFELRDTLLSVGLITNDTAEFVSQMGAVTCTVEQKMIQRWIKYWYLMKKKALNEQFDQNGDINQADIELASHYPYQDVYEGNLRQIGGKLLGLCPFHDEKTPSFTIFLKDNYGKCFGCNWYGSVIDYVMEKDDLNFVDAVKRLR